MKITLINGAEFLVYEQTSKYYICENTQFKKTNPLIAKVEKIKKPTVVLDTAEEATDTKVEGDNICL